jgi:hypothetical protein
MRVSKWMRLVRAWAVRGRQSVRRSMPLTTRDCVACSPKPKAIRRDRRALDDAAREQLRELIRRSPRDLGYETSLWTLELLAQACFELGITRTQVTGETIRATLAAMGISGDGSSSASTVLIRTTRSKKAARLAETAGSATLGLAAGGRR